MIKNRRILILGAGQIGEACAIRFIKDRPKEIILHTLFKEEALLSVKNIEEVVNPKETKLTPSWGNVLVPKELAHTEKNDLINDSGNLKKLLEYYYGNLSDKLLLNSSLYQIVKKHRPNLIIDAINTATVVGYLDDPYSLPRKILSELSSDKKQNWLFTCTKVLSSAIIPSLIRFTQVIQKVLKNFNIDYYIKVSTTGLGGMGINLMYTHGDINEPGMSSGILGKVAAAGVFHQLMWSLSHTPGYNIRIVTPSALVGWQPVKFGKFRSHGKNLPVIDNEVTTHLKEGKILETKKYVKKSGYLEIPYVDSGENSAYSLYEMETITALGQMESITREEVAEAVYESTCGSTKYDLLTAMDYATLGPTYAASFKRNKVLNSLRQIQNKKRVPSIATNNLGPTVSKHLFELYILLDLNNYDAEAVIKQSPLKLSELAKKYVLKNNIVRKQALSLGLPILFDGNEALTGDHHFVPDMSHENIVSKENVDKWADAGWIDLRKRSIENWQKWFRKVLEEYENNSSPNLTLNYQAIKSGDIGEVLGLIYSLQGGTRKK